MSPLASVADAYCGVVHEPVKIGPPVNFATGPPEGKTMADWIAPVARRPVDEAGGAVEEPKKLYLLARDGEQPM